MVEKTYSVPEKEIFYAGNYPDMHEFEKPWEQCIQVGQGNGRLSDNGSCLQSEGFARCFGVVLRNKSTLDSAVFHVDDIDFVGKQPDVVGELMERYVNSSNISDSKKNELLIAMKNITKYWCPENMKRDEFQSRMEELNKEGVVQACFVYGTISRDAKSRIMDSLFGYLGIKVSEDLVADTGKFHWDMVYNPKESGILVNDRKDKKVLSFKF